MSASYSICKTYHYKSRDLGPGALTAQKNSNSERIELLAYTPNPSLFESSSAITRDTQQDLLSDTKQVPQVLTGLSDTNWYYPSDQFYIVGGGNFLIIAIIIAWPKSGSRPSLTGIFAFVY